MYSLRILNTANGQESNVLLGNSYTLLKYEEYNAEQSMFNNHVNSRLSKPDKHPMYMSKEELKEYVYSSGHYATVISSDGKDIDLFFNGGYAYYVMIEGNTYCNLTKR